MPIVAETDSRVIRAHYNSATEFLDEIFSVDWDQKIISSMVSMGVGKMGRHLETKEQVRNAVDTVWTEGLDILRAMQAEIASADIPAPVSRKRKRCRMEDDGSDIDIDRFRDGQPDYWVGRQRRPVHGPQFVTVLSDASALYSVPPRDVQWRGLAALALVDLLETAGYRVRLVHITNNVSTYREPEMGVRQSFILKDFEDPCDVAALVGMTSAWFYRTVMWQGYYHIRGECRVNGGLGRPTDLTKKDIAQLADDSESILISGVFTREAAIETIQEAVKLGK